MPRLTNNNSANSPYLRLDCSEVDSELPERSAKDELPSPDLLPIPTETLSDYLRSDLPNSLFQSPKPHKTPVPKRKSLVFKKNIFSGVLSKDKTTRNDTNSSLSLSPINAKSLLSECSDSDDLPSPDCLPLPEEIPSSDFLGLPLPKPFFNLPQPAEISASQSKSLYDDSYQKKVSSNFFFEVKASYAEYEKYPEIDLGKPVRHFATQLIKPLPQIAELLNFTSEKKGKGITLRFVVNTELELLFSPEGCPSRKVPAHSAMVKKGESCISAGNIVINEENNQFVIKKINHKSGHFRPSFNSLAVFIALFFVNSAVNPKVCLNSCLTIEKLDKNGGIEDIFKVSLTKLEQGLEKLIKELKNKNVAQDTQEQVEPIPEITDSKASLLKKRLRPIGLFGSSVEPESKKTPYESSPNPMANP